MRARRGILAIMSSLTSLTSESSHGVTFNATFYATVATVIPVLYLAFAVQGTAYQNALRAAFSLLRTRTNGSLRRETAAGATFVLLLLTGSYSILLAGFFGEAIAINALYNSHDDPALRNAARLITLLLSTRGSRS